MDYTTNNYRFRKVGGWYFVTTDSGSHTILNESDFRKLREHNIDEELYDRLVEREIILDESNIEQFRSDLIKRNSFLFNATSLHIIVVTLRCNMKCVYCHASSVGKEKKEFDMDKETAKKTVDFIFQSPNPKITIEFQGGEPLLNWEVVKYIVEYANEKNKEAKKNILITIVTNLVEMDKEKMDYLIANNVSVCTSLDGPKELHDYNRKFLGGSNYEQVTKWIKKFSEEYAKKGINDKRINALVTLTKRSLDFPKEIIDEYVRLGLNSIHLRFLNNLGVAKKARPAISYSANKYLEFWKKAVNYIEELKNGGANINERMIALMFNKINNAFDPNYMDLRTPCGAAIGQMAYNHDGNIYTCDEARMIGEDLFLLGNVKNDLFKDVVTCNKACATVAASINDQYICDCCAYKPYCGVCPVCNYAEQGNVIGKISQTDRCKIFKAQFDWVVKEKFIKGNNENI